MFAVRLRHIGKRQRADQLKQLNQGFSNALFVPGLADLFAHYEPASEMYFFSLFLD